MSGLVVLPARVAKAPGRIDALESMCPLVSVAAGGYAAIPDAAPLELADGSIRLGYTQAGTGDPSPSNIRAISGWQNIIIHHTGKNLIPIESSDSANGITFTVRADGSLYFKGTCTTSTASHYTQGPFPAGDFVLSGMLGTPSQAGLDYVYRLQLLDLNDNVIKRQYNPTPQEFSLGAAQNVRCYIPNVAVGAEISGSYIQPMARVADFTDATFEGYRGEDIIIPIPGFVGTVCGGTYNPVTGALTLDRVYVEYDGSASVSIGQTGTSNYYYQLPQIPFLPKGSTSTSDLAAAQLISNQYISVNITSSNTNQGVGLVTNNNGTCTPRIRYGTEMTTDAFKAELGVHPLQVSYLLKDPVTYQISPAGLTLYSGCNTIWSDTGNISITYRADPYRKLLDKILDVEALVLENIGG